MRVMGLDVGDRTIGVAISDENGVIAQGLTVLRRGRPEADMSRLEALCQEYAVGEVVVGLPRSLDGHLGSQAEKVLAFVERLHGRLQVPVATWDERLTTRAAERVLLAADLTRRRRRAIVDQVAASLILEGYLAARQNSRGSPGNDNHDAGAAPGAQ